MKQGESTPALKAVLDHQAALSNAQQELQRLNELLSNRRGQIAQADQISREMMQLQTTMEDLQADIEAGEDKSAELGSVQARHKAAQDALGDVKFDVADSVVAGLERKIDAQRNAVSDLQGQRPVLMRALLLERAEALGEQYAAAAKVVIDCHHRINRLNHLLAEHGRTVSLSTGALLEIPSFELESVKPHAHYLYKAHLARGPYMNAEQLKWREEEVSRLVELGVDMSAQGE